MPYFAIAQNNNSLWKITKPAWTEDDEIRFGQFVTSIGQAVSARKCRRVDTCIKSAANPYRDTDPADLKPESDCADFPYFLRSYFAWKNGLPMSLESIVTARPVPGNKGDLRYTTYGNIVLARYDVLSTASVFNDQWLASTYPSAVQFLNESLKKLTWSAAYRMMGLEDGDLYTDYYPAKISRDAVRPGTVIYDPNGHVTIIWKIGDDGRIYYIDSHPDNTVSSGMFNSKFSRSIPDQGAGFKNFRPLILAGATKDSSGAYVGGKIIGAKNATLALYGKEQFYGTNPDPKGDWKKGKFVYNGNTVSYYDYVRMKMAKGALKINPETDMKADVTDICDSLQDRVEAVQAGIDAGIQNKEHPERLPENIYGTTGEWENYASPARDARLKMVFMELLYSAKNYIARYKANDPTIVYKGKNLAKDLLSTYQTGVKACKFSYVNSAGVSVNLDMEELRKRLFLISFDPYHCVELRWGASESKELSSCHDDPEKFRWYRQERWLRYQWERQFEFRMDYSLEELIGPLPGTGIAEPPDVDIEAYLNSEIKK
ncbi:hypothetical protein DOE51_10605 [Bdellovibrio sp. NC01]|nr:hypothetical protein DOE51_10605 [Bdellovibrio sp. NC01]